MMTLRLITVCGFFIAIASSVVAAWTVGAAEIDSVTTRRIALEDSRAAINVFVNARLRAGVANANQGYAESADIAADEFCNADSLYRELRKAIFDSNFLDWGLGGYNLDQQLRNALAGTSYSLKLEDSIYRDIDYLEGFSLRLKELSDVVSVDAHLVGLDKLGHFFAEGWEYFEKSRKEGGTLQEALEWGRRQEAGKFGFATTGIFSFADLVANFNGWRFWRAVLGEGIDPLAGKVANWFARPYVACETQLIASITHRRIVRAWDLNREFDIKDYIDGAWDEGNNCNSYADPLIEQKVMARADAISVNYRCPVERNACVAARRKYGHFARHLLHPACLGVAAAHTHGG